MTEHLDESQAHARPQPGRGGRAGLSTGSGSTPPAPGSGPPAGSLAPTTAPTASTARTDRERVLLLECRVEEFRSALDEARAEADRARARLAEAAAREAEHGRRNAAMGEELATARAEVLSLHRRLERSDAFRAELEGRFLEAGPEEDAGELVRLRREALSERQRRIVNERTLAHLRARVDELRASRDAILTRVAEWQRLVRNNDADSVDLAEFIAELRRDILDLEHQNEMGEREGEALRELYLSSMAQRAAGEGEAAEEAERLTDEPALATTMAPDGPEELPAARPRAGAPSPEDVSSERPAAVAAAPPADDAEDESLFSRFAAATDPADQTALLLRLGRSGDGEAIHVVRPWTAASEPLVRAAAYEALSHLEKDLDRLEPHMRDGLSDPDARVRRRVVLAVATSRDIPSRKLLEPMRADPDPRVRRLVIGVLRKAPPGRGGADPREPANRPTSSAGVP